MHAADAGQGDRASVSTHLITENASDICFVGACLPLRLRWPLALRAAATRGVVRGRTDAAPRRAAVTGGPPGQRGDSEPRHRAADRPLPAGRARNRAAFVRGGVEALGHPPRRRRTGRALDKDLEQPIRDTTLKTRPVPGAHWSVRTLARQLGVSRMVVQWPWARQEIQPHRVEKFKLSTDPQFVEKVREIVGLYLDPPE